LTASAGGLVRQTKSDRQGSFDFDGISPGQYTLVAEAPPFVALNRDITLSEAQQQKITTVPVPVRIRRKIVGLHRANHGDNYATSACR
jgi:hypothetical protein